jgi:hypothetical protein
MTICTLDGRFDQHYSNLDQSFVIPVQDHILESVVSSSHPMSSSLLLLSGISICLDFRFVLLDDRL